MATPCHTPMLLDLTPDEGTAFAEIMKLLVMKYDELI
jgi:hypothetical protein